MPRILIVEDQALVAEAMDFDSFRRPCYQGKEDQRHQAADKDDPTTLGGERMISPCERRSPNLVARRSIYCN